MEVFIIRHGQQHYEDPDTFDIDTINAYSMGEKEGPLTSRGLAEAVRVAEALRREGITHIYASPLIRAQQTAKELGKMMGLEVGTLEDLHELRCGRLDPERSLYQRLMLKRLEWTYRVFSPLSTKVTRAVVGYNLIRLYFDQWLKGRTVDGEKYEEAKKRIGGVLNTLAERHDDRDNIACVCHGYFMYFLVNFVVEPEKRWRRTLRRPYLKNGCYTRLRRRPDGEWEVAEYAYDEHVKDIPEEFERPVGLA